MRRSFRPAVVMLAASAALVALVSTGCTPMTLEPAKSRATPSRSAVPRATPTSTPTPAPIAAAPSSRVATTCDRLVPDAVAQSVFRLPVTLVDRAPARFPAAYADERAGSLICWWESATPAGADRPEVSGWIKVIPDATHDDLEADRTGSVGGTPTSDIEGAREGLMNCSPNGFQYCGFEALTDGYGIQGGVLDTGDVTYAGQSAAIDTLAASAVPVIAALPAPTPLWEPAGESLRGATDCDGLVTPAQIDAVTGWSGARPVKSDGGEYALSSFRTNARVGSYSCTWIPDTSGLLSVAVLPGGASYATATRPADAVDVPGLGDAAYRSGDTIDVVAADGWLQVDGQNSGLSDDAIVALARQALANVGG